jgi:hypothetical protein
VRKKQRSHKVTKAKTKLTTKTPNHQSNFPPAAAQKMQKQKQNQPPNHKGTKLLVGIV